MTDRPSILSIRVSTWGPWDRVPVCDMQTVAWVIQECREIDRESAEAEILVKLKLGDGFWGCAEMLHTYTGLSPRHIHRRFSNLQRLLYWATRGCGMGHPTFLDTVSRVRLGPDWVHTVHRWEHPASRDSYYKETMRRMCLQVAITDWLSYEDVV